MSAFLNGGTEVRGSWSLEVAALDDDIWKSIAAGTRKSIA